MWADNGKEAGGGGLGLSGEMTMASGDTLFYGAAAVPTPKI